MQNLYEIFNTETGQAIDITSAETAEAACAQYINEEGGDSHKLSAQEFIYTAERARSDLPGALRPWHNHEMPGVCLVEGEDGLVAVWALVPTGQAHAFIADAPRIPLNEAVRWVRQELAYPGDILLTDKC